jgi:hypothetical protein
MSNEYFLHHRRRGRRTLRCRVLRAACLNKKIPRGARRAKRRNRLALIPQDRNCRCSATVAVRTGIVRSVVEDHRILSGEPSRLFLSEQYRTDADGIFMVDLLYRRPPRASKR